MSKQTHFESLAEALKQANQKGSYVLSQAPILQSSPQKTKYGKHA